MRWGGMPEPVQEPPAVGVGGGDERVGAEVDVEERALRALEEDALLFGELAMQPHHRVGDERGELLARFKVRFFHFAEGERLAAERFEDGVVFLDAGLELGREILGPDEVDDAQAGAGGLVSIRRADAALGGADFVAALAQLALFVEQTVVGEDEVGRLTDEQAPGELDAALFQALDFRPPARPGR